MIVIKFGGTSVGSIESLRRAIEIVAARGEQKPVVVVSALSGVTNQLVEAAGKAVERDWDAVEQAIAAIRQRHEEAAFRLVQQKSDFLESFMRQLGRQIDEIRDILRGLTLVGEVTPRSHDRIVATGEKLSSVLFAYTMRLKMLTGIHVDSEDVVVTDERFGGAAPDLDATRENARRLLLPELERRHIPVMGGFIGRSRSGATTTLGRGGSDYSAAIIGAVLDADEIQIWTDVDGMMTTDPRIIPGARIIDRISYVEAAELAYFGAKVLHPKTITPAVESEIPIRVLNTHNPDSPGTLITASGDAERHGPRAIALKKGISSVHITASQMLGESGFLARIFDVFGELGISVDLVTTSEVSVSLTIDDSRRLDRLEAELTKFADVRIERNQAVIALVGRGLVTDTANGAAAFQALAGIPLTMVSLGRSNLNLSIVLGEDDADRAVRALHRSFFERENPEPGE